MPVESISGRGATRNASSTRFNLKERIADGDWLDEAEGVDGVLPRRTTVTVERPKSILTRNSSPDLGFDRSINPYRGCEHGCIYCFARPTHAFHDLSPGVDFESRLFAKPDAAKLLHAALSQPGYSVAPIALGTNTDPYQPIEGNWRITRSILELLLETKHPFTITTKSDRVVRDLDIIGPAARLGIAAVAISVTSLDPKVHSTLEPRAPAPRKRLAAIKALSEAGVPTFASIAPVIPQITDHELEALVEAAAEAGARGATFIPVRLPHEVAPLFRAWLDEHYPDRAAKVMATIQSLRGGKDNDPHFFTRMRGSGPWAELIRTRFEIACRRHNLPRLKIPLRRDLFEPPQGDQLRLF
jgi:DNA repair photolyase